MSIADKLLQVNQVKQDIKTAIETKGVPMTDVAFTEYANKILKISGGWDISYEEYALALYYRFDKLAIFQQAWQDSQNSKTVLYDIPLTVEGEDGMNIYAGTDGTLEQFYNDCVNGVITSSSVGGNVYLVNNAAEKYFGNISGEMGFSTPIYQFGSFGGLGGFIIGDLTELEMGSGIKLVTIDFSIPNNNIVIQQDFEFENENGIILPDSVTSIGNSAFNGWSSNNQPLVIPNSVTIIGEAAFADWQANNQPLVIPNSVTNIGNQAFDSWTSNNQPLVIPESVTSIESNAFRNWTSNNQPLVIPNSVTSIESNAFYNWTSNNQPLVIPNSVTSIESNAFYNWTSAKEFIMESETPPTITSTSFSQTNDAPIYVPDESLDDYKTATNWVQLSSRIKGISELEE